MGPSQVSDTPLITVVDDDPLFNDLICNLLAEDGYRVHCCTNSQAALTFIRVAQPALVIDFRLREEPLLESREEEVFLEDGTLEIIRQDPKTQMIPVMICSADTRFLRVQAERLRRYQCEIVEKPFDANELVEKVARIAGPP